MVIAYNQMDHLKIVLICQLVTGLKTFHKKYTRRNVFIFISGETMERTLEIFAASLKLVMLFDAILDFAYFTHNQNFWLQ